MAKSKLSIRDWDVADYLKTEEDIALFLEAASELEPRDSGYMERVIEEVARARRLNKAKAETDKEDPEWTEQMVKESVRFDDLPPPLQRKLKE